MQHVSQLNLSEEDFKDWRESPTTEAVFKYLADWQISFADSIAQGIMSGRIYERDFQVEANSKREVIMDLIALEFSEIEAFYNDK